MGKPGASAADQLAAAQEDLRAAHAKLVKEFDKIHRAKFSAVSHRAHLEKLRAHLIALEAQTAAIRAQHEALHARRQALHEQYESEAVHAVPSARRPRTTRSR
jgi:chromosome segregation ATPase